jgi:hypothetical protein
MSLPSETLLKSPEIRLFDRRWVLEMNSSTGSAVENF